MRNKFHLLILSLVVTSSLFAQELTIKATASHIVIMQTDAETIWGSYYFAIQNSASVEQEFTSTIRLPRESVDFQAGEGLSNENISILDDGVLSIRKMYKPGLVLQGIQFKVPVKKDSDNILRFVPVNDVPQFYFATPQTELLRFAAEGFEQGIPPMLAGGSYSGIRAQNIRAGQEIRLAISGFPGGRLPFFILGACMGLLLILLAAFLTVKTSKEGEPLSRGLYD